MKKYLEDEELDKDEKYVEANLGILQSGELSDDYKRWIKSKEYKWLFKNTTGLTNAQRRFAEWLFTQKDKITVIGEMNKVFMSVRQFLKHQK